VYHNIRFEIGFRADLIVDNKLLIEVKATDQLLPVPRYVLSFKCQIH
jgi:hypothetical protein